MGRILSIVTGLVLITTGMAFSQQISDSDYSPDIGKASYATGCGPLVYIDEGHNNFHTREGRYMPFALLLEKDGYNVKGYKGDFNGDSLGTCRILVISNALNVINKNNWYLPTPSAFTDEEIKAVTGWVRAGGSLFLIADHMPMAGAVSDMAEAFGIKCYNGFALDTVNRGPSFFYRDSVGLCDNIITNGNNQGERINKIVTFTGQAFRIPEAATPILTFDERYTLFMPDTAWVFDKTTRVMSCQGLAQGAYLEYGKGKVVMFGEAAMFTAQLAGPDKIPVGMNSPYAGENYRLLLNIIHWLDK